MIPEIVKLEKATHTYWDFNGNEYESVSHLFSKVEPKFDEEEIAGRIAKKEGKKIEEVIREWQEKKEKAINHGIHIDNIITQFLDDGSISESCPDYLKTICHKFRKKISHYRKIFLQQSLASTAWKIAGTPDLICFRGRKDGIRIFDIYDYKTNLQRGIEFCSKYRQYFRYPLQYLEACNYNEYTIKLSLYGWLLEETLDNCKIGNLSLIFIKEPEYEFRLIPVSYQKSAALELINYCTRHKPNSLLEDDLFSPF